MNRETRSLLLRFAAATVVLFALARWEVVVERVREPYCELLAASLAGAFRLIGIDVQYSGATVRILGGSGITVIPECDGIVLLSLLISSLMPSARTGSRPVVGSS